MWLQTSETGTWKSCPVSEWKWLPEFKTVSRGGCVTHSQRSAQHAAVPRLLGGRIWQQRLLRLSAAFRKVFVFVLHRRTLSSVFAFTCAAAAVTLNPPTPIPTPSSLPPPPSPSLHSLTSVRLTPPPRWLVVAHSRQRQNSVGMNTPNATRMGNIRLLLSAAYGFGVRGPDWTLVLEPGGSFFFPPSSPPSVSSSSSSSSSGFSKPGWGWSFGTSVK